eukprot:TRINITY_DN5278_c0_g2_i1.p1 TRINITY_DN5278_c0_g2~~TRINITY_DN5278_c0_g2_i1.p1  ORF type:complete len:197 (+),score=18.79 TRINITY_DN5278_c0_g2_i1:240-830(+)
MQALIYAFIFREKSFFDRMKTVIKQMIHHGRNLGLFVFLYKSLCFVLRKFGISGGLESLISGFIGGFCAFGDSSGISGSVNNQITLYLLARSIQGLLRLLATKHKIIYDVKKGTGFRIFAGSILAMALYMTEYQSDVLTKTFMRTMNNLYYDSDQGELFPAELDRFMPFVGFITFTLIAEVFSSDFGLSNLLNKLA